MTELQHDPAPDRTATRGIALDGDKLQSAGAVVSIRVWSGRETNQLGEVFSESLNPAACLAIDLMVASGGDVVLTQGNTLVAAFTGVPAAILAARRLQWAFQGLSETDRFDGTGVAVLIHSNEDLTGRATDDAFSRALDQAAPGQILLGENASRTVDDLPGLATEMTFEPGLRELLWRSTETEPHWAAGEQTLFRNIKEQVSRDRGPSGEPPADAPGTSQATVDVHLLETREPGGAVQRGPAGEFRRAAGNARRLIWGGSAAALLCAVGLVAIALHRQSNATSPPQAPPPKIEAPVGPPPSTSPAAPPASSGPQTRLEAVKAKPPEPDSSRERSRKQPAETPREKPSAPGCDLGAAGIQRTLTRAENSLHAGKLGDAQRDFQSVVDCDRTNAQAQGGLRLVRERRAEQR